MNDDKDWEIDARIIVAQAGAIAISFQISSQSIVYDSNQNLAISVRMAQRLQGCMETFHQLGEEEA